MVALAGSTVGLPTNGIGANFLPNGSFGLAPTTTPVVTGTDTGGLTTSDAITGSGPSVLTDSNVNTGENPAAGM
jgi:hypothetical protein